MTPQQAKNLLALRRRLLDDANALDSLRELAEANARHLGLVGPEFAASALAAVGQVVMARLALLTADALLLPAWEEAEDAVVVPEDEDSPPF